MTEDNFDRNVCYEVIFTNIFDRDARYEIELRVNFSRDIRYELGLSQFSREVQYEVFIDEIIGVSIDVILLSPVATVKLPDTSIDVVY